MPIFISVSISPSACPIYLTFIPKEIRFIILPSILLTYNMSYHLMTPCLFSIVYFKNILEIALSSPSNFSKMAVLPSMMSLLTAEANI